MSYRYEDGQVGDANINTQDTRIQREILRVIGSQSSSWLDSLRDQGKTELTLQLGNVIFLITVAKLQVVVMKGSFYIF